MIDRRAGAPSARPDSRPSLQKGIVPRTPTGQPLGVMLRPNGFQMIESFEAENFRCFDSVKLTNLKRVNIITGENASGKTVLLEAFFAAARGAPEALLFLNQFRGIIIGTPTGIPAVPMIILPEQFPALWHHWFYSDKKNGSSRTATNISFRYKDSKHKDYSCEFKYDPYKTATLQAAPISSGVIPFLTERTEREPDKESVPASSTMTLNAQGQLQSAPILKNLGPSIFIFTAALNYAEMDNVTWFSQLRELGETKNIVEFFKTNFPFIESLEVLQPTPGGVSGI